MNASFFGDILCLYKKKVLKTLRIKNNYNSKVIKKKKNSRSLAFLQTSDHGQAD